MNDQIFVYGLLRSGVGHPASRHLRSSARLIGTGYTQGKMYDTGQYPAVVLSNAGNARVYGEVYTLTDPATALRELDDFEQIGPGYPKPYEYMRRQCTVDMGDREIICWIYLYNRPIGSMPRIGSGDYVKHLALHP